MTVTVLISKVRISVWAVFGLGLRLMVQGRGKRFGLGLRLAKHEP